MNFPRASVRNQLTRNTFGGLVTVRPDVEPVLEVVAHVVAAEREHRHGIAAQHAGLARRRGSGFRRERRAEKDAVLPVLRFVDERHALLPARAEHDRVERHAVRVLELR